MASALNVTRRKWRRILVENWGKPGEKYSGMPWYSSGALIQHYTPGLLTPVAFCGARTSGNSSAPIRTLIGVHCPVCTHVLRRIVARIKSEEKE